MGWAVLAGFCLGHLAGTVLPSQGMDVKWLLPASSPGTVGGDADRSSSGWLAKQPQPDYTEIASPRSL